MKRNSFLTKTDRIKKSRRQITLLEKKREKEILELGSARNSTLVKYNRHTALLKLFADDLVSAEKHVLAALGYLQKSYREALDISNSDMKKNAMHGIVLEHKKLLIIFAEVKLSFHAVISVESLKDLHSLLSAVVISQLIKENNQTWMIIFKTLSIKLHNELFNFIDDEKIIEYIETEIVPSMTNTADDFKTIQWVCVMIYQALVKRDRRLAVEDVDIAEKLARYRHETTARLHELGNSKAAIEDLAEAYFFEILASTNLSTWKNRINQYSIEYKKVLNNNIGREWVIYSFYAKSYVKGFNLAKKIQDKHQFIRTAMQYAETGKLTYANYIKPHLYITELLMWLQESSTYREVLKKVKSKHKPLIYEDGIIDENYIQTIDLYRSVVSIVNGNNYEKNNVQLLDSFYNLAEHGIITNEREKLNLLTKILSHQTNAQIFLSSDNNDSVSQEHDINEIQRLEGILKNHEGSGIEVKLSADVQTNRIAETICGFANADGGRVIIGLIEKQYFSKQFPNKDIARHTILSREFVLIGCKNLDNFRQKLASHIKAKAELHGRSIQEIYVPNIISIGELQIMIIEVASIFRKHGNLILLDGKVYSRYDNQTSEMKAGEIVQKMTNKA